MSEKKRVFFVTASFGCEKTISCETADEVKMHIEAEVDNSEYAEIGDTISITIGEMTQQELDDREEFDGC
jgi:hypothetical protein